MPEIAGENSVPLGVAGSGAAYVLSSREPNALALLQQGERARALHARNLKLAQQKADQDSAKQFNDFAKFQQDGSPYFGKALSDRVYQPVMNQMVGAFKRNRDDAFTRNTEVAPILQRTNNETVQSKAKTQYITDKMRALQGDAKLYNTKYAGESLAAALRGDDGQGRLPSEFDEEAWNNNLLADHHLYNEPEVVRRATEKLVPAITQRVAEAGSLGGQHSADQVRGRFVAFDGKGKPILNADGSPKLALNADTQALLEADPLLKLKLDAREAAYNQKREADPSLPRMSRRGHISQMIGPLAFYDTSRDEGLNPRPPQPRSPKADANEVRATPTVRAQASYFRPSGSGTVTPNHYAAVGQSFGSTTKPYVEVAANNGQMEVIGQNGEVTRPNSTTANGQVPMRLMSRDYVLFANGKRLGQTEPFETEEQAHQKLLKIISETPHPEQLELRLVGHGVVVDKTRTAGDGLGGSAQPIGYGSRTHKPVYDTTTGETYHDVLVPITQEIDAQLQRATKGKWNRLNASLQENELIRAVKQRGGRVITPYNNVRSLAPATSKPTTKAERPAWLQPKSAPKQATTKSSPKAADNSGGML